jgi:hypothetical protein
MSSRHPVIKQSQGGDVTNQLPAIIAPGPLTTTGGTDVVPSLTVEAGDTAGWRCVEFFTAYTNNDHTRRASPWRAPWSPIPDVNVSAPVERQFTNFPPASDAAAMTDFNPNGDSTRIVFLVCSNPMDEQLPLFPVWPVLADDEIMTVLRGAIGRGIRGTREADVMSAGRRLGGPTECDTVGCITLSNDRLSQCDTKLVALAGGGILFTSSIGCDNVLSPTLRES